ncbi:MAG TPA: sulfurtransferase complex subunit TusD [Anaerolineae bacterium]|nr:sulfurtransferase complex subunit TusD [Anaerolineae bacterium]HOQ97473.1 sulfurtransferase complex subunit TusD [Anaerolineae bacterium]HPL29651.1 sulfurtransferase complex subunit TusD [Anaerolineae bacterium]
MKIGVMILEGPYQHQAADSAYQFIQAARARGHEIVGVFLYSDGVNSASRFVNPPGERNVAARFEALAAEGVAVVACTACAKFRGLTPQTKSEHVRLAGLGSLAELVQNADRFITFGG